MKSFFLFFF